MSSDKSSSRVSNCEVLFPWLGVDVLEDTEVGRVLLMSVVTTDDTEATEAENLINRNPAPLSIVLTV